MKKTGSLTKRAILFTAIIAATMVVVALLVYLLAFGRGQDLSLIHISEPTRH